MLYCYSMAAGHHLGKSQSCVLCNQQTSGDGNPQHSLSREPETEWERRQKNAQAGVVTAIFSSVFCPQTNSVFREPREHWCLVSMSEPFTKGLESTLNLLGAP